MENAANFHVPQRGMIGDVQANSPYARTFLFDEQSVQCHFYQLRMTCTKQPTYLSTLIEEKSRMLPMGISNHKMFVNKDFELKSTLITSAPVVVMINLHDFKIKLQTIKVCPKFVKIVSHHGCHSCAQMATVVIEAISTCLPGEVRVNIDSFPISTSFEITNYTKPI